MQALYQQRGQIVQNWLKYPFEPCPIPQSTLTFQDLSENPVYLIDEENDGPLPPAYEMNYPNDVGGADEKNSRRYILERDNPRQDWYGFTAPGVLFVENIKRQKTDPPRKDFSMSEVSMAIYNHRFDTDTLRYVIFAHVTNQQTLFIGRGLHDLYKPTTDTQIWDYGSPEYQKLLGTRLGKLTAYMLLGAFDRGSRRIARVVTWTNPSFGTPWVRFDIEVVSPCDIPLPSVEPSHFLELPGTIDRAIGEGRSISMMEMLPPPAIPRAFHGMTLEQTAEQRLSETRVVHGPLALGNEPARAQISRQEKRLGSSKALKTPGAYTSSCFLGVGDEPVQAPRAVQQSQKGSSSPITSDPTSDQPFTRTRELESSSESEGVPEVREPATASSLYQSEQTFTDLREVGLPLAHLQIQGQFAGLEVPRLAIPVPTGHTSDLRTRSGWNISIEDLDSQIDIHEIGSSVYPLGHASSNAGQLFYQRADTDLGSQTPYSDFSEEPTAFFTPPEYSFDPDTPVEFRDRITEIECFEEFRGPTEGSEIRVTGLTPVLPTSPSLDVCPESIDAAEMLLN